MSSSAPKPTQEPFSVAVDGRGELAPATSTVTRHLSDMAGMYLDSEAEARLLAAGDPLIYEVYQYDVAPVVNELLVCTTILHPGTVGEEFFMTKGHFHEEPDRAEVYYGISGSGRLVLGRDGVGREVEIGPGTSAYVPPYWAHRTANTGTEPFVFLAVYPGDAGHDYGTIETDGFPQRLLKRNGGVAVVGPDGAALA
ncbi:MAG: glucose-6-phosphate isomerase family protein [Solirubrobacterales bacterium]